MNFFENLIKITGYGLLIVLILIALGYGFIPYANLFDPVTELGKFATVMSYFFIIIVILVTIMISG